MVAGLLAVMLLVPTECPSLAVALAEPLMELVLMLLAPTECPSLAVAVAEPLMERTWGWPPALLAAGLLVVWPVVPVIDSH